MLELSAEVPLTEPSPRTRASAAVKRHRKWLRARPGGSLALQKFRRPLAHVHANLPAPLLHLDSLPTTDAARDAAREALWSISTRLAW